jgi:glycosyltransferase involved in cell wall biosynthesis
VQAEPAISVVVPTYRRPDSVRALLGALARQSLPPERFEVLVVDDGGGGLESVVAGNPGRLRLLTEPHRGPGPSRDAGARAAAAPWLAFTDDDCQPEPGWLEAIVNHFGAHPGEACAGRVVNGLLRNPMARASQSLHDTLAQWFLRDGYTTYLTGNNFAVPRALYWQAGGHDPAWPLAGGEDRVLAGRLAASGAQIRYVAEAAVVHRHNLTLKGFLSQHYRYGRGAWRVHGGRSGERKLYWRIVSSAPDKATSMLLVLSQMATAAGFAREAFGTGIRSVRAYRK